MDRTVLTLAVDSSQVGTAAAAFDRMVNAGNAAASSAGRVTSATLAQGRTISQALIPALNTGINRTRTLAETQQAMGQDASRQVAQVSSRAQSGFAAGVSPRVTVAGRALPSPVQGVSVAGAPDLAQLTGGASSARAAIERLTAAARNDRNALVQLAPAAATAAGSYRQLASTPIRLDAQQGLSAASAALGNLADRAANARRAIADLGRTAPAAPQGQGAPSSAPTPRTPASNQGAANAFTTAATAATRGTTATNAFTAAQGRAAEAAQHLAEANARNEAANARLAAAIQRATAAQTAFDNASRTPGNAEAVAQAQTRLQSAQAAVSTATANVARSHRAAADAAERHRVALAATGRQSTLTAAQTVQLHYQLHDFFVQVAAGQSPLTALIQQGSQLSGTFGGAGGALRAVLSVFTPLRVAAGGVAGAVAALGYAFYEGSRQSKAFADAVVLTGNYAGQTEGKITALTRQIAAQGQVTASAAREAAQAAISSGQVGPQVFAQATEAIALYAKATDQTAADVIKDFASMAQSPSKWAEEHNRTLHFITAAQYDAIKAFEDGGKAADAQAVIYTALIERLHKLDPNLGTIERTLRSVKNAWSNFWDAAYDIGRTETIEGKIASLDAKIRESRRGSNPFAPASQSRTAQLSGNDPKSLEYDLQDQLAGQARKDAEVINEATRSQAQQAGIAAKTVIDGYLKRGKAASAYKDALDKLNRSFKDAEAAGTPVSAADKRVALTELKKEYTPAGSKNSEASQVLRAQLQNDLKGIQDVLLAERDALSFQQNYLQSVYQRGGVSLTDYYEQRRKAISDGVQAELEELDKEKSRLEQYLGQTKDPSEKVQTRTRINEIDAEKSKIELRGSRDTVLVNEEESSSYRALSEQVTNYRANLLQMQGDEAGAAALRAQTVIANAKVLAAQANALPGAPKVDVEALTRAIAVTDQFNEVQRQTSLLASTSARAEEAFVLASEQSGKSLMETERGLYALRSTELAQLGALAAKAKELADASTDPKIKAFAADLALEYAKAANAIDPALNRLREANRELASGLANTAGQAPAAFIEEYSRRRSAADDDIKRQKDEYSRKIDILEGYLATTQDKQDKARLRERIKAEEARRDSVKGESRGSSVLKAINNAVVQPMAAQVFNTVNKLLITDPLQAYLQSQLKGLTEGSGLFGGFFKDALGIKADPKDLAQQQQTAAIQASTSAVDALRVAAEHAANALNRPLAGGSREGQQVSGGGIIQRQGSAPDSTQPPPVDSELAGMQSDAAESLQVFDKQTVSTASDVLKLANAAGVGGNAMVRLPGIVGMFQSAVLAMQASSAASSGGGIGDFFAKLFGGSSSKGGAGPTPAMIAAGQFHSGGIVGQPSVIRAASPDLFANAPRYHTGGIVGKAADKVGEALKHNEVPAILMGGPKGKREEVLRADDPRHRDNLSMSIVARILAESKSPKSPVAEAAKSSNVNESRSSVSKLIQSISGNKGESSASVLAGLLDRMGVKDGEGGGKAVKVRGARELGGPVSAGGMYRVNEKGPELLQVAGKQYLMTGSQGGNVVPNGAIGKGGDTIVLHVNVTPPAGGSTASAAQWGAMAGRHIQRSMRRNT